MEFYIYKLYYREEPQTIYIGKTVDVASRLTSHLNLARLKANTPKNTWIKDRNKKGWLIQCDIIETLTSEETAYEKEIFWISFYKSQEDFIIKNGRNGGIGGMSGLKHSEETKQKISKSGKGRVVSEETKEKMRKPKSQSHRDKIGLAKKGNKYCLGVKHSVETREKMSVSKKGLKVSQNMIDANSKRFEFINPDGELIEVFNLSKFCRENNLTDSAMNMVFSGKRNHHKGYKRAGVN